MKEEIGALLTREYSGEGLGFTTVTTVNVTADLRQAKVYVSVFGPDEIRERTMKFLAGETPHIRSILAGRMRLRFMPSLVFHLDDTLDHVDRINTLLKQIHRDDGTNNGPEDQRPAGG
jgi:ribosome-binding factor A